MKHVILEPVSMMVAISIAMILTFISCQRDDFYLGNDITVGLSTDTLRVDTVFTSIGSATRIAKLYNPKDQPILIDVALRNQTSSVFRFNVDGVKGPSAKGIEIGAKDSIYVFIEATVNPDQPLSISPFIIEDQLIITANGTESIMYLEAWGQNANYIPSFKKGGFTPYLSCDLGSVTWDDPRPYVIYGVLVIDSCTLIIPEGTRIYVHGGVVRNTESIYNDGLIYVQKYGNIVTQGTSASPVIIQGDRLEQEFANESGQWVGILFWHESVKNVFTHTYIKNSIIGVRVDSMAELTMNNCIITNTASSAVIGNHSRIYASNCQISNSGSFAVALTYGGDYQFDYCTIANYGGNDESLLLTDFYCSDVFCSEGIQLNPLKAIFRNTIITGNGFDEIGIGQRGPIDDFNISFDHCAFPIRELTGADQFPLFLNYTSNCTILKFNDRVFNDVNRDDYSLDTMSILLSKATPIIDIPRDLLEKVRKEKPDPGCYEF